MGKIVRNSIAYTGSSNIAGNISYNNSQSQLRSTTVQNAITELSNEVINGIRQVTVMPTASLTEVGNIYQYIGETSGSLTHGYIYECRSDGGNPAVYSWVELPTFSASAEGGVGRTEEDLQGNPLGEYFNLYEDYTDPVSGDVTPRNSATGEYSHVEGFGNSTSGSYSHVEGHSNKVLSNAGSANHIEGFGNESNAPTTHIEGQSNIVAGLKLNNSTLNASKVILVGKTNLPTAASAQTDKIYVNIDSDNNYKAWEVYDNEGTPDWQLLGTLTKDTTSPNGHMEGSNNISVSEAHVEGNLNYVGGSSSYAHAEGISNVIGGGSQAGHVEGSQNFYGSGCSFGHVEGYSNTLNDGSPYNHIEGNSNSLASGNQNSHIEGSNNTVTSGGSYEIHIEGKGNSVGYSSGNVHVEGRNNTITGSQYAANISGYANTIGTGHVGLHVEGGSNTVPNGKSSVNGSTGAPLGNDLGGHIEGVSNSLVLDPNNSNMAVGKSYHIEGEQNKITYKNDSNVTTNTSNLLAQDNHIEGGGNSICGGIRNHIEGNSNWANADYSHAEGSGNKMYQQQGGHVEGQYNNISGYDTIYGYGVHYEGYSNTISGFQDGSHVEGKSNSFYVQSGYANHIEGEGNTGGTSSSRLNTVEYNHIEGIYHEIGSSVNTARYNHIEGQYNELKSLAGNTGLTIQSNHVEGNGNDVAGYASHTEGQGNQVWDSAEYAHTEGYQNIMKASYGHVEGQNNSALGWTPHVEGANNTVGSTSYTAHAGHAEGQNNTVLGSSGHVQGANNTINGGANAADAGGQRNEVLDGGHSSIVRGMNNKVDRPGQAAIGYFNRYEASNDDYSSNLLVALANEISDDTTYSSDSQTQDTKVTSLLGFGMSGYIPVKASLYKIHGIVPAASTSSNFIYIGIYNKNKVLIAKIKVTDTEENGYVDYILDIEKIIDPSGGGSSFVATEIGFIRFTSLMSAEDIGNTSIQSALLPTLMAIGNGYSRQESGETVTVRQNILEVSPNFVNINGDIYQNGEPFREGVPHFVGTTVEWAALSSAEKAAYTGGDVVFTDDNAGVGIMDNVVTKNSQNPVTSAGIYAALAEITRPDPHISTNGFYYAREYYDGRQVVHYRRHFGTTTFTANATKTVEVGSWAGLPEKFDALLEAAFQSNNYVINAIVFKDDPTAGQSLTIGSLGTDQSGNYLVFITCNGAENYVNGFTLDITMDTF